MAPAAPSRCLTAREREEMDGPPAWQAAAPWTRPVQDAVDVDRREELTGRRALPDLVSTPTQERRYVVVVIRERIVDVRAILAVPSPPRGRAAAARRGRRRLARRARQ